jgi:hypothetical protein
LEAQMAQQKARPTGQQLVWQTVWPWASQKGLQLETQMAQQKARPTG